MAKLGGRVKGTPNKSTQDLFAICEKHGINVFEGMLMFCKDPDKIIAMKAHTECAKYLYPQRKAVEVKAEVTNIEAQKAKVNDLFYKLNK